MPCSHCHKDGHNRRTCTDLHEYQLQVIDIKTNDILYLIVKKKTTIQEIIDMIHQLCGNDIVIQKLHWNNWNWSVIDGDLSITLDTIGILDYDCIMGCVKEYMKTIEENKNYSIMVQNQKDEYQEALEEDLKKQKEKELAAPSINHLRELRLQRFMKT